MKVKRMTTRRMIHRYTSYNGKQALDTLFLSCIVLYLLCSHALALDNQAILNSYVAPPFILGGSPSLIVPNNSGPIYAPCGAQLPLNATLPSYLQLGPEKNGVASLFIMSVPGVTPAIGAIKNVDAINGPCVGAVFQLSTDINYLDIVPTAPTSISDGPSIKAGVVKAEEGSILRLASQPVVMFNPFVAANLTLPLGGEFPKYLERVIEGRPTSQVYDTQGRCYSVPTDPGGINDTAGVRICKYDADDLTFSRPHALHDTITVRPGAVISTLGDGKIMLPDGGALSFTPPGSATKCTTISDGAAYNPEQCGCFTPTSSGPTNPDTSGLSQPLPDPNQITNLIKSVPMNQLPKKYQMPQASNKVLELYTLIFNMLQHGGVPAPQTQQNVSPSLLGADKTYVDINTGACHCNANPDFTKLPCECSSICTNSYYKTLMSSKQDKGGCWNVHGINGDGFGFGDDYVMCWHVTNEAPFEQFIKDGNCLAMPNKGSPDSCLRNESNSCGGWYGGGNCCAGGNDRCFWNWVRVRFKNCEWEGRSIGLPGPSWEHIPAYVCRATIADKNMVQLSLNTPAVSLPNNNKTTATGTWNVDVNDTSAGDDVYGHILSIHCNAAPYSTSYPNPTTRVDKYQCLNCNPSVNTCGQWAEPIEYDKERTRCTFLNNNTWTADPAVGAGRNLTGSYLCSTHTRYTENANTVPSNMTDLPVKVADTIVMPTLNSNNLPSTCKGGTCVNSCVCAKPPCCNNSICVSQALYNPDLSPLYSHCDSQYLDGLNYPGTDIYKSNYNNYVKGLYGTCTDSSYTDTTHNVFHQCTFNCAVSQAHDPSGPHDCTWHQKAFDWYVNISNCVVQGAGFLCPEK